MRGFVAFRSACVALVDALGLASSAQADEEIAALASQAREAGEAGDPKRASELWLKVIASPQATRPQLVEAHQRSGLLELEAGHPAVARRHFEQALRVDPGTPLPADASPDARRLWTELRSTLPLAAASSPSSREDAPTPTSSGFSLDVVKWIPLTTSLGVVTLGLALLTAGTVAGGLAFSAELRAQSEGVQLARIQAYDQRDTYATLANAAFVVGGVVIGAGAIASVGAITWLVLE